MFKAEALPPPSAAGYPTSSPSEIQCLKDALQGCTRSDN